MLFEDTIEIPFSKNKSGLFILAAIVFAALGIWFIVDPDLIHLALFGIISINNYFLAILLLVMAIWITMVSIRRMRSTVPAILLDKEGIVEYVTQSSVKEIKWADIEGINRTKINHNIFIILLIKNPEEYIDQQTNSLRRQLMKANYKSYGSPVTFSCSHLKYSADDVFKAIEGYLERIKTQEKTQP